MISPINWTDNALNWRAHVTSFSLLLIASWQVSNGHIALAKTKGVKFSGDDRHPFSRYNDNKDDGDNKMPKRLVWSEEKNEVNESSALELDYSLDPRRVVAKVYDQGDCKTGWAYAMVGQLEGQEHPSRLLKGDRIEAKSKQQLIRCQGFDYFPLRDHVTEQVSEYLMKNAIALEIDIPKPKWTCLIYPNQCPVMIGCSTYKLEDTLLKKDMTLTINGADGDLVEMALKEYGPLAFFMNSWTDAWDGDDLTFLDQSERTPIIRSNHAILLVGHSTGGDGSKFFKFKNSFGPQWGNNGYGYIRRSDRKDIESPMRGTIQLFRLKRCKSRRLKS